MDKNFKQKTKDFFKKEGFFVVLFLCLCVVTMVAAVTIKKAKVQEAPEVANDKPNQEIAMKQDDEPKNVTVPQGAEQVNKNKKPESENKTVVSTTVKFTNPVEGAISRGYTVNPIKMSDNEWRTVNGINVESKVGTDVKAAADGIVEFVGDTGVEYGIVVEVKHSNGITTKYCNLDKNVKVKKGDKVTSSTIIGKVGTTAKVFDSKQFGEYLNIQVWNGKDQVDPTKYFTTYKTKK
ncbi:MAG: peptidoglycan DD-metalloendopeptidase family protein [Clostridium sp.]